jgi:hypothetical protein
MAALRQVGVLDEVIETKEGLVVYGRRGWMRKVCESQIAMVLAKGAMTTFFAGHASLN